LLDIETIHDMRSALDSDGSVDVGVDDAKRTKIASIEFAGGSRAEH
jgi:hypothetical protein